VSKPLAPGQTLVHLEPAQQVRLFADLYRDVVNSASYARLAAHVNELGLQFSDDELLVLAALDTPARVQAFLNTQIYYNNDHASAQQEETAMSPRRVLQTALAHCFEGAMFAYAVDYLHGHEPRLVMLEASQDSEHNLVLFQDPQTGLVGVNAHSAFPHLDGRPAQYASIRAIAESYFPYYYSDRTKDPADLTLVGYSEPFDLATKFGVAWMGSEEPLWEMYYTYVDDSLRLYNLFDDSGETHLYPLIQALKSRWIQVDAQGHPFVRVSDLPSRAQELWAAFWRVHEPDTRPHGEAREIERQFQRLFHTTPIDLQENAEDLVYFMERGFCMEQLLTQSR
jgi:hypothetical protein